MCVEVEGMRSQVGECVCGGGGDEITGRRVCVCVCEETVSLSM